MGLTPTGQRRGRAFTKPERKPKRSECLRGGELMLAASAAQGRVFRRQHRKAGVRPMGLTPTVQRREQAFTKLEPKPKRSECLRRGELMRRAHAQHARAARKGTTARPTGACGLC